MPSNIQFSEYHDAIKLLADDNILIHNYVLEEIIRLTENLVCRPDEDVKNNTVINFAIKATNTLLDYQWIHYDDSTSTQLEFFLHAMSSVLHVLSKSVSMIDKDTRDPLYKSVSKFWGIYRKTRRINANIVFSLREIRTCLKKIKDDRTSADHAVRIGGNLIDAVISAAQKEYLAAFGAFINIIDFEYAAGEWYYDWTINREKYFALLLESSNNDFDSKKVKKFYKKIYKYSIEELEKIKRKNTKYNNFEYKVLKSGGMASGKSLPDNIDTLLIGYLDLIQRLLENFFPQIKKHINNIIGFCNEIIEIHIKKQLTFKAAEVLYFIKEICGDRKIGDDIESNFNRWSSISSIPTALPPRPLSAPNLPSSTPNPPRPLSRRLSAFETPASKKVPRKRIIDDVVKLFEDRNKIKKNIDDIKTEYGNLRESFEESKKEGKIFDETSILSELMKILQQHKDKESENKNEANKEERERLVIINNHIIEREREVFVNSAKEDESNSIYSRAEEISNESNSTCSHHSIPVDKVQVEEPDVQVEEPDVQVEEPDVQVEELDIQIEELDVQVEEPDIQVEEPDVQVEEPDVQVEEPDVQVEEPDVQAEELNIQVEELNVQEESDVQVVQEPEEIKYEDNSEENNSERVEYDIDTLIAIRNSLPPPYNEYDIEELKRPEYTIIIHNYIQEQKKDDKKEESSFLSAFRKIVKEVEVLVEKASKAHQAAVSEGMKRLSIVSNSTTQPGEEGTGKDAKEEAVEEETEKEVGEETEKEIEKEITEKETEKAIEEKTEKETEEAIEEKAEKETEKGTAEKEIDISI